MNINGTLTTKSGSWAQVKKHVDRNWVHDKNEANVNKALSKYNIHDRYEDVNHTDDSYKDKLIKKHYSQFIKDRNLKFKKQGHLNRQQTLSEYLKHKTPTALGIATFGTMQDKHYMMTVINEVYKDRPQRENDVRYYKCGSEAWKHYVISFNRRNKYIKITHWWTNNDEHTPHVHFEMLPLGFTKLDSHGRPTKAHLAKYKSGKHKGQLHRVSGSRPTGDLTKAVCMEFGTNNNRLAFKKWNDVETKAIVRTVGTTFQKRFSKITCWQNGFKRQHTGRQGSLSMKSYKATWQEIDRQRQQLADRKAEITKCEQDFSPLQHDYERYSLAVPELKEKNDNLNDQNDYLSHEVAKKRDDVDNLNQQQTRLEQIVDDLKAKKKRLEKWLHDKWIRYRDDHLGGFYHGLARAIGYLYPEIESSIFNYNQNHLKQRQTLMDFATGKYTWGSKQRGYVGGIKLFLRGLADRGRGWFKNYQDSNDLTDSFTKHPDDEPTNDPNDTGDDLTR